MRDRKREDGWRVGQRCRVAANRRSGRFLSAAFGATQRTLNILLSAEAQHERIDAGWHTFRERNLARLDHQPFAIGAVLVDPGDQTPPHLRLEAGIGRADRCRFPASRAISQVRDTRPVAAIQNPNAELFCLAFHRRRPA